MNKEKGKKLHDEFHTLSQMRYAAIMYLLQKKNSLTYEEQEENEKLIQDINKLYDKYANKINNKFFENTGKVIF